ncbi:MAG: polyprenyl diphosphate synthase [Bacteriovoracaceae bacterium]
MSSIKHVAIIMDGNGRWAQKRLRPRVWGHIRGSSIISNIVEAADGKGLNALTLYAFSTENWSRPIAEVSTLFNLLKKFLIKERTRLLKNNICFKVIGDITNLPVETQKLISETEEMTKAAKGLKLTFAFSYGGRSEILNSVNQFIKNNPNKEMSEKDLASSLYNPESGDVDLLIRTGGDQRISNFLLWQMAYAELYFTPTKWPDFSTSEFKKILDNVTQRERRFGSVCAESDLTSSIEKAEVNKSTFVQGLKGQNV